MDRKASIILGQSRGAIEAKAGSSEEQRPGTEELLELDEAIDTEPCY
jgi:hypothetical protein